MAILPILKYPDQGLKEKTVEIQNTNDPLVQELILDMLETMKVNNGMGLAANQVGSPLRLCVIKFERKNYILINPRVISRSWKKEIEEEGCLSFPGQFIPVKRAWRVKISALDKMGKKVTLEAEGLLARAFQHEIDHLDGILFIERV